MNSDPNFIPGSSPGSPPGSEVGPNSGRSGRSLLRTICMILIAGLFVVSVPWYREADAPLVLWLGLPDWVAVALLCYVGVAVLNGVAWLATEIPDALPQETSAPPEGPTE